MKFLLLLVVVLAVLWLLRSGSRRVAPPAAPSKAARDVPADAPAEAIVACAHCGLHLPHSEALPGRGGVFCSEAHRAAFELAAPR